MDSSSSFSSPSMDVFEPSSSTPPPPEDPFLETYPTKLHSSIPPPTSFQRLRVYWSHDDDPQSIQDKIKRAFQNLPGDYWYLETLIQFWAPVGICGRQLLTTSDQPFVLYCKGVEEHRLRSLKYHYNINVDNLQVEEEPITIIIDGPPASAFLNRIPELLHINETIHPNPLLSSGLECGLKFSFVVPVFYPSQGDCVGVVECSLNNPVYLFSIFNELNMKLKEEDVKTFHAQHHLPYKGLQIAKKEIDEASETILQTHSLPFCQVLIPYEVENQVAFSPSLHNTRTKQKLLLKLTGHNCKAFLDEEYLEYLETRSTAYDWLPIKMDELFVGKTLENYEPCFIQDIWEVKDDNLKLALPSAGLCSRFVICLRSPKTGDLDYVFEFFWKPYQGRNNVILLKQLFITLMKCLPSFKFASSTYVGDKIDILDFNNSKGSENKYIKIFQGNKASLKRGRQSTVEESLMPLKPRGKTTPIELTRKQIESQFGQTLEEAARKLNVSVSTLKRNCNHLGIKWHGKDRSKINVEHSYKNQSNTNEDQGGAISDPSSAIIRETSLDENILTIKAEYAGDKIKFTLLISSATYEAIQKEIVNKFKLDRAANYKLKYLDDEDNEWFLFNDDEDLTLCTKNKRTVYLMVMKM